MQNHEIVVRAAAMVLKQSAPATEQYHMLRTFAPLRVQRFHFLNRTDALDFGPQIPITGIILRYSSRIIFSGMFGFIQLLHKPRRSFFFIQKRPGDARQRLDSHQQPLARTNWCMFIPSSVAQSRISSSFFRP